MALDSEEVKTHNCPVQGEDTPLVKSLNIETDEIKWICVWCLMANHILGENNG